MTSTPYSDKVNILVDKVEKQKLGQQVLLVRQWSLPTLKCKASVEISKFKPFNIVEEFILKIALSNIKETVDQEFVSNLLGLDEIFVEKYATDLANSGVIFRNRLPEIFVTNAGKDYFNKGLIPATSHKEEVDVYFDPLFKSIYHKSSSGTTRQSVLKDANEIEDYSESVLVEEIQKYLNKQAINRLGKKIGKIFERDDLGQTITNISFRFEDRTVQSFVNFIEIWIYDIVEDKLFCRVWDEVNEIYREDIEAHVIETNPPDKDELLTGKEFFKDYPSDIMVTNKYENIIKENLAILRNNKSDDTKNHRGTVRLLRGAEIHSEFQNLFNKVRERLIIFSPWITEKVVDGELIDKFREVVKRGACIFIGWGISKKEEMEKRKPSAELIEVLSSIKDKNGLPAVFISWLGNRHEKEIVVDQSILLVGSLNWLSYRGDYLPRGESVCLLTDKNKVREAFEYWQEAISPIYEQRLAFAKHSSDDQLLRNLAALLNIRGQNAVDIDDLVAETIKHNRTNTVFNILLLLFFKKRFGDTFERCLAYLAREGSLIPMINSVLHRLYRTEKTVFEAIARASSKTLIDANILNRKGKLIKKTEMPLNFLLGTKDR